MSPAWGGLTFRVQPLGDIPCRSAGDELAVDASPDLGFGFRDLEDASQGFPAIVQAHDLAIVIASSAGKPAGDDGELHAAPQPLLVLGDEDRPSRDATASLMSSIWFSDTVCSRTLLNFSSCRARRRPRRRTRSGRASRRPRLDEAVAHVAQQALQSWPASAVARQFGIGGHDLAAELVYNAPACLGLVGA